MSEESPGSYEHRPDAGGPRVMPRALLLTPSRGLGGGIERYVETLEWAFSVQGVEYRRIDLRRSGAAAHVQMLGESRSALRESDVPTRLVLAHRTLLPISALLCRESAVCGTTVVCHGSEVWSARRSIRWHVEKRLMRHPGVRVVAASSFTSGALSGSCPAAILPPGLSREWFQTLVRASSRERLAGRGVRLITAFRLRQWRGKGLPELLGAVRSLGRSDVYVTVCGTGEPDSELRALTDAHPGCTLRPGIRDHELAREFAAADLFVLASRTRPGLNASGEGFGLVLLEAQVAGTPVVGPAYGGSRDAYIEQVTGVTPADETTEALAEVLDELLCDQRRLAHMGQCAANWARECFAPERYASQAVARLL